MNPVQINSNYDDPTKISTFTRKFDNHGSRSILQTSPYDRIFVNGQIQKLVILETQQGKH